MQIWNAPCSALSKYNRNQQKQSALRQRTATSQLPTSLGRGQNDQGKALGNYFIFIPVQMIQIVACKSYLSSDKLALYMQNYPQCVSSLYSSAYSWFLRFHVLNAHMANCLLHWPVYFNEILAVILSAWQHWCWKTGSHFSLAHSTPFVHLSCEKSWVREWICSSRKSSRFLSFIPRSQNRQWLPLQPAEWQKYIKASQELIFCPAAWQIAFHESISSAVVDGDSEILDNWHVQF